MSVIRCPNCGKTFPAAEIRAGQSFLCRGCGTAIAPPAGGDGLPVTSSPGPGSGDNRWSEGPPEESASRWSAESPLGDDSFSSDSVSQTSILPEIRLDRSDQTEQPVVVPPRRSRLVWVLLAFALFLVALIGMAVWARSIPFRG
jgi:hypothetical protein